jgi:UDP-N-acetylmuramoyl-tripeptide--D-alanyl-D-alanine ligase
MNHKGELSLLSDCLRPDVCVITNVGSAHIGNLGSRERIALAKLEILDGMNEPLLLAPANEPLLEAHRTFSVSYDGTRADFMLNTKLSDQTRAIFDFYSDKLKIEDLTVYATGAHIPPALAFSLSLCSLLGIDEQSLKYAAAELRDSIARSTVRQIGYLTVIDDTYNSSPEAVLCALKTLRLYKNRRISAVLGDMLELGENSEQYHRSIGKACANAGLSRLYTFGKYARVIADGAISGGMRAELISTNEDMSARHITAEEIMRSSLEGDVILFKASNAVGLDRVIRILDEKITKGEDSRE